MSFEHPPSREDDSEGSPLDDVVEVLMRGVPASSAGLADRGVEIAEWYKRACQGLIAGKYEVRGELGCGGMGVVLEAFDLGLGRRVAIKRPLPGNEQYDARFKSEAKVIAGLKSEYIRGVLDFDEDEHGFYLVMEFVDGSSLQEHLGEVGSISRGDAFDLAQAMAMALKVAHDSGVIHRDVKPGNVLVSREGKFKLADFGLARPGKGTGKTRSKPMGTPRYVAPEQWRSAKDADERSDLYGLGKTLWFALTGETPFGPAGKASLGPFARLVTRCTEREPDARYQTAAAVLQALEELRARLPERRGGSPAPWRSAGQPGVCPECRTANLENHRYCSQCMALLREPCPNCAMEVLTSAKYCGTCRIDIRNWKEVLATLERAAQHAADEEYERAHEEVGCAGRLAGGRPEFESKEFRAHEEINALLEARQEAEPLWEEERYEEAVPFLEQIVEIVPDDRLARERLDQVDRRIRERDLGACLSTFDRAISEQRIASARRIIRQISGLGLATDDPRVSTAMRRYRSLRSEMIRRSRLELVTALDAHDWQRVDKLLARLSRVGIGQALLLELQLRAKTTQALHGENLTAARAHLGRLSALLEDAQRPWMKKVSDEIELAETRRLRGVRTLIEQCHRRSEFIAAHGALIALDTELGTIRAEEIAGLKKVFRRRLRRWKLRRVGKWAAGILGPCALAGLGWAWQSNRIQGEMLARLLLDEAAPRAPKEGALYLRELVVGSMLLAEEKLKDGGLPSVGDEAFGGLVLGRWCWFIPGRAHGIIDDESNYLNWGDEERATVSLSFKTTRSDRGFRVEVKLTETGEEEELCVRYREKWGGEWITLAQAMAPGKSATLTVRQLTPFEHIDYQWRVQNDQDDDFKVKLEGSCIDSENSDSLALVSVEVEDAESLLKNESLLELIAYLEKHRETASSHRGFLHYWNVAEKRIKDAKPVELTAKVLRKEDDKEGTTAENACVNSQRFLIEPKIENPIANVVQVRWRSSDDAWRDWTLHEIDPETPAFKPGIIWSEGETVELQLRTKDGISLDEPEWSDPICLSLRRDDRPPVLISLEARAVPRPAPGDSEAASPARVSLLDGPILTDCAEQEICVRTGGHCEASLLRLSSTGTYLPYPQANPEEVVRGNESADRLSDTLRIELRSEPETEEFKLVLCDQAQNRRGWPFKIVYSGAE